MTSGKKHWRVQRVNGWSPEFRSSAGVMMMMMKMRYSPLSAAPPNCFRGWPMLFFCQRLASLSCFISTPIQQLVWAYCVHNFRIWRSQCSIIIGWKSKNDLWYHLDINWHKEYYFFVLTGRVHSQLLASLSNWSRIIFTYFAPYPSPGENEMDICWRELRVTCE